MKFSVFITSLIVATISLYLTTAIHNIKYNTAPSTGFSEFPRVIGEFNDCDIVRFVANGDLRPGYVMDCSKDRLSKTPVMN